MTRHRILVLGGGYTGVVVAGQLARRLDTKETSVKLITESAVRDERMRWHQLAAGGRYRTLSLVDALKGSDVGLRVAHVEDIDLRNRSVSLGDGADAGYDTLVVALESVIDFGAVPGAQEYAHGLTGAQSVRASAQRLAALPNGTSVSVIGGGLTGLELATEIAESHPRLKVTLVSSHAPGAWLSVRARRYLARVFDQFGIATVDGRVVRIGPDSITLADGRTLATSLTYWAGGFRAHPLVEESGLAVDGLGRAIVDGTFRAGSHPEVRVVGDAAHVPGPDGSPLKMGCRTGAFMALAAPGMIARQLAGTAAKPFSGRYYAECISLGRRDALLQWLTPDGTATDHIVTGYPAAMLKEAVHWGTRAAARHPGPYVPAHRARPRSSQGHGREGYNA